MRKFTHKTVFFREIKFINIIFVILYNFFKKLEHISKSDGFYFCILDFIFIFRGEKDSIFTKKQKISLTE